MYSLTRDLESRLTDRFLPSNVTRTIAKLEDGSHFWMIHVVLKACEFYSTALEYIKVSFNGLKAQLLGI